MSATEQFEATQAALEKWAHRRLGRLGHERRVARIAGTLLEVTAAHRRLDPRHRRLIALAAIVHDVGRSVNDERHPQLGAKLIAGEESLPLSKSDRRALCYLTRYHRGAVPKIGKDDYLKEQDDREQLYLAIAYLRAADALDSRTLESPRLVMRLHRQRLHVTAHVLEPTAKVRRVYRRRRKFKLLEELLNLAVDVTIVDRKSFQSVP